MKIRYILLLAVMLLGTASAQYLTYSELISYLKIAHDIVKVDDFLVKRGYEFKSSNPHKNTHVFDYEKNFKQHFYRAGGQYEVGGAALMVSVSSSNVELWNYYKNIVASYGYKQVDNQIAEDGSLWIFYENLEYELLMMRANDGKENSYFVTLNKLE